MNLMHVAPHEEKRLLRKVLDGFGQRTKAASRAEYEFSQDWPQPHGRRVSTVR